MKRRFSSYILLILALIIILSSITCLFPTLLPDTEDHKDLLLEKLFYTDADVSPYYKFESYQGDGEVLHELYRGIETQIMTFKSTNDRGYLIQYIFRFRNELTAIYDQKSIRNYYLPNYNLIDKLSKIPINADRWWSKCKKTELGFYCAVIARYDNIIMVTTFTYDDSLSGSYIDEMLMNLDEHANNLLWQ